MAISKTQCASTAFFRINGATIECSSDPNFNINCLDIVVGVTHTSIDDNIIVTQIMKNRLDYYVYYNNILNIGYWGSNECE